ncbi:MAG: ChbG/HpnK family deacetylase [Rickettsiales bacterium]|jgi:predicted glycoside hydrolase/deacetylase ChbG (UPF0249 family)|nr:ChbG/HpnK family deacetylase [Rickettsiales bacterium]
MEKIINADDFGLSPEVNRAIETAARDGCLNSTSLMVDEPEAKAAARLSKSLPGLKVGIHLDLKGYGFVHLLALSIFHRDWLETYATSEFRRQIEAARKMGIDVAHLDSHRHIHMIPLLFGVAEKLRAEYGIKRLRVVNEDLLSTLRETRNPAPLWNGGLVKYILLKFLGRISGAKSKVYFYSILNTMRLYGRNVRSIRAPGGFSAVEIAIHPSTIGDARLRELATLLDKDFPNRIL